MKTRSVYAVLIVSERIMQRIVADQLLPKEAFFDYDVTNLNPEYAGNDRIVGKAAVLVEQLDADIHYSEAFNRFGAHMRSLREYAEYMAVGQNHDQENSSIRGICTTKKDRFECEGSVFEELIYNRKAPFVVSYTTGAIL